MIPALQFDYWQWMALQLATPVVIWGAWPFHRAAWANLKHATATMDTLISLGVLAAWTWSLYALFLGDAGMTGMRMTFDLFPEATSGAEHIYLEIAAVVTTFILAGRYFEARAKRRAGAALQALLELGAKDVALLDADGTERRIPIEQLQVGDRFVVRPGEKVATDGDRRGGQLGRRPVAAHRRVGAGREGARATTSPGATINAGGRLVVRATKVGVDTALAQIARLVTDAQTGKAPVQRLADRISGVFVPIVIGLAVATLGFWLGAGEGAVVRLQRRGRRADHRLPLRARPGDADGAAGRHRPRRPARPADQGPGGARVHPPRRHDRARQDRHRDDRQDGAGRGRRRAAAPTATSCCGSPARSRTPPSTRSPGRSPPPPASELGELPAVEGFANREGLGVEGVVDGHGVRSAARR